MILFISHLKGKFQNKLKSIKANVEKKYPRMPLPLKALFLLNRKILRWRKGVGISFLFLAIFFQVLAVNTPYLSFSDSSDIVFGLFLLSIIAYVFIPLFSLFLFYFLYFVFLRLTPTK